MELTAQNLQEVTFGAKVRGYDPAEVDDFIAVVAEGVEELRERLRRVTERATRAEQQLAEGGGGNAVIAPVTTSTTSEAPTPDYRQVLGRAVAAAEAALEEAQADAERLRTEARSEVDRQLAEARQQADSERSSAQSEAESARAKARAEADSVIANARDEAARVANESQGQLRAEITQLEQARNQLKSSVDELSSYLDSELSRVRGALADAMAAIDNKASGAGTPPEVGEVEVPPLPEYVSPAVASPSDSFDAPAEPEFVAANDDWNAGSGSTTDSWNPAPAPDATATEHGDQVWGDTATADEPVEQPFTMPPATVSWDDDPSPSEEQPTVVAADEDESVDEWSTAQTNDSWGSPQDQNGWGQPSQNGWGSTASSGSGWGQVNGTDDESDPFLAELRRAVRDDEPLGPRSGDDAINSLYADDEADADDGDDKNGFFRRKK